MKKWLNSYTQTIENTFKDRVLFIGLQGSYGRGEATDSSDIDIVLILDQVTVEDLNLYKEITAKLPHRELLCGFVSGKEELAHWCRHDLFQFYHDTTPIQGSLDDIIPTVTAEEAWQAVHIGACNIYHGCSHNYLHTADVNMLSSLYKSAFFVLQAKHFCECGQYIKSRSELEQAVMGDDLAILHISNMPSRITADTSEEYTARLLSWSSSLICQSTGYMGSKIPDSALIP